MYVCVYVCIYVCTQVTMWVYNIFRFPVEDRISDYVRTSQRLPTTDTFPGIYPATVRPIFFNQPPVLWFRHPSLLGLGRGYIGTRTDTTQETSISLGILRQTSVANFNPTWLSRLVATKGLLVLSLLIVKWYERYVRVWWWLGRIFYDSNLCLKYVNRRRRWMHQLWESRTDGAYFKLCKILTEFPDKFRKYYRMNIKTFDYITESVKLVLPGYPNFRKCNEAKEKLSVALRYVLDVTVRIEINYICKILNATTIQCYLKGK